MIITLQQAMKKMTYDEHKDFNLKIYKEKQFLYFYFFNDSQEFFIKYDLQNNNTLDENDDIINPLYTPLHYLTIQDMDKYCDNENYIKLFRLVAVMEDTDNLATIVYRLDKYKHYEQIYSAGLRVMNYKHAQWSEDFKYNINEIPTGLQKICRDNNVYLDTKLYKSYTKNPDACNVLYSMRNDYKGLKKTDLKTIMTCKYNYNEFLLSYFLKHGYNAKKLFLYLDYLKSQEKIINIKNLLIDLRDYVNLSTNLYNNDYERYPKNFTEKHDELSKNYKVIKNKQMSDKFNRVKTNKYNLEFGKYKFYYPKSISDIELEGHTMNNCVATYIEHVLNGDCHILFLRYKDHPNDSLVTIEVRNDKIVQARRKNNMSITEEDKEAVDYFNNYFNKSKPIKKKKRKRKDAECQK